ncbi:MULTISPECIES: nuclease-related domain-containing protein [Cyanophyceae]|uniref:nuclease-related domain-containing protein n=1 Tax=Cyanophyceae TaxID=3028117 RepID=UPI0016834F53|nr:MULTISPECIES: nuclease-related domain-containing protein [Cyanophyceae]MBD1917331.1 NERD domain-containing protein [Phormidium sp. FACHB-77]MBD2032254.1 NERD domain-containing protein [Phormidium sp. FACHB-322]MBD2053292.1 NERD domain-containing protein [Leptolyngbya sp. FACHB-60]
MIAKELDPIALNASKQVQAGHRAEEQMAFYLRRAFGEDPKIKVLNGLRLERWGEVAQIDHLLISTHGFILIESKSVTTQIRVNEQGEWSRQVGSVWQGMPSPLLQVERQAELLKALLNDHVDQFFRKVLTLQFTFASVPFDGLVAISDIGVIQRPPGFAIQQVLKADQITKRIQEMHAAYRRASNLFSLNVRDVGAEFGDRKVTNLAEFLLQQHSPQSQLPPLEVLTVLPNSVEPPSISRSKQVVLPVAKPQPERPPLPRPQAAPAPVTLKGSAPTTIKPQTRPDPSPQPQATPAQAVPSSVEAALAPACRACGSSHLIIVYGKYGYYFKCADCEGNTPIKVTCANGEKAKISKRGREFYLVCQDTPEPQLFYVNPET